MVYSPGVRRMKQHINRKKEGKKLTENVYTQVLTLDRGIIKSLKAPRTIRIWPIQVVAAVLRCVVCWVCVVHAFPPFALCRI